MSLLAVLLLAMACHHHCSRTRQTVQARQWIDVEQNDMHYANNNTMDEPCRSPVHSMAAQSTAEGLGSLSLLGQVRPGIVLCAAMESLSVCRKEHCIAWYMTLTKPLISFSTFFLEKSCLLLYRARRVHLGPV